MKRFLATVVVSSMLLAGCASSADNYQPSLDFEARTISDTPFSGSDLQSRDALVWFWTPWCAICAHESQDIALLKEKYPEVTVIGIAGYGTAEEMRQFAMRTGTEDIVHLNDSTGELWTRFEVPIQPSVVALNDNGSASLRVGPSTLEELEQLITELLDD